VSPTVVSGRRSLPSAFIDHVPRCFVAIPIRRPSGAQNGTPAVPIARHEKPVPRADVTSRPAGVISLMPRQPAR
jgi:hypothetical protein